MVVRALRLYASAGHRLQDRTHRNRSRDGGGAEKICGDVPRTPATAEDAGVAVAVRGYAVAGGGARWATPGRDVTRVGTANRSRFAAPMQRRDTVESREAS